jgi:4-hydroxythreonine-4-phosphate dehydrogenase
MEKNKIRVGITQGDINGIGYEVILKTFDNPEMFDICTPVVYGSPKAAAYHRKALEMETPYNAVSNAVCSMRACGSVENWRQDIDEDYSKRS